MGLKGKSSWAFNVFTLPKKINFKFWKCEKYKNVFALGPTALDGLKRTLYEKNKGLAREMEPNGKVLFGRNKGGKPQGVITPDLIFP